MPSVYGQNQWTDVGGLEGIAFDDLYPLTFLICPWTDAKPERTMDLCENCQELTYSFTMPMTRRERRWKTEKTILLHHASIRCQLCQMFHDHLLRLGDNTECMLCDGPHINSLSSTLQSVTLLLDIFECKEYEDDVSTQRYSQCIIEYRGNDDKQLVSGHITLELWADEGMFR